MPLSKKRPCWIYTLLAAVLCSLASCTGSEPDNSAATVTSTAEWEVDFFDDFDSFNPQNWQDQLLWVNDEGQCYVPD